MIGLLVEDGGRVPALRIGMAEGVDYGDLHTYIRRDSDQRVVGIIKVNEGDVRECGLPRRGEERAKIW